ncbi:MAG: hypothetical protein RLN85_21380, partial [Pseudomonadales bacterium]
TIRIGKSHSSTYIAGITNATNVDGAQVVVDSNGRLGVGRISQILQLSPLAVPPAACNVSELGSIYVDSDSAEMCFCDGTSWTGLKVGGACN